jgi:hypothetical protein
MHTDIHASNTDYDRRVGTARVELLWGLLFKEAVLRDVRGRGGVDQPLPDHWNIVSALKGTNYSSP